MSTTPGAAFCKLGVLFEYASLTLNLWFLSILLFPPLVLACLIRTATFSANASGCNSLGFIFVVTWELSTKCLTNTKPSFLVIWSMVK